MMRILVLMMLCMIAVSCSESEDPNPPIVVPEIPKYTVTINCSDPNITVNQTGKLVVIKGTTVKIVATPKAGFEALVSIDRSSFTTSNDTVELVNISSDYFVEFKSKEIIPIPPIVIVPTRIDTLCSATWKLKSSRIQQINGSGWATVKLLPYQLENLLSLYPNGRYNFSKGVNGLWSLSSDGNILTIENSEYVIVKLTIAEMVVSYKVPYYYDQPDENGKYILKGYVDAENTYIR